jgi:hypothetical protein
VEGVTVAVKVTLVPTTAVLAEAAREVVLVVVPVVPVVPFGDCQKLPHPARNGLATRAIRRTVFPLPNPVSFTLHPFGWLVG